MLVVLCEASLAGSFIPALSYRQSGDNQASASRTASKPLQDMGAIQVSDAASPKRIASQFKPSPMLSKIDAALAKLT